MTSDEHTGPVLPPSAIALRQGRSSLAEAARQGDLSGYPAAAAALMDAYFRARLAELAQDEALQRSLLGLAL